MSHEWKSIDIHPEIGEPLACISVRTDGTIKYRNFGDDDRGPYYYRPNKEVSEIFRKFHKGYFDNEGQTVTFTHWMYWEEFWEMLEGLPRIEKGE